MQFVKTPIYENNTNLLLRVIRSQIPHNVGSLTAVLRRLNTPDLNAMADVYLATFSVMRSYHILPGCLESHMFTITKYKGFNPDIGNGGDPLSRGIDEGRFITGSLYPLQRTILFGLNVSF